VAATLIGFAAGEGTWFFGGARAIWPNHPQIAAIVIGIVVSMVVLKVWPNQK
jgi:hypothetical protein